MKLYKETGTNPLASCLPLLLQMPIFFALFRVIDHAAKHGTRAHGLPDRAAQAELARPTPSSSASPIADTFTNTDADVDDVQGPHRDPGASP